MNNLAKRVLTAIVLLILLAIAVLFKTTGVTIFIGLVALACMYEYFLITEKKGFKATHVLAYFLFALAYLLKYFGFLHTIATLAFLLIGASTLLSIAQLYVNEESPFSKLGIRVFGVLLISTTFISLQDLVTFGNKLNLIPVLMPLTLIWANDIFAYFGGRMLGKTPLFKRHSPNKTIEGLVIGMLFSGILAYSWSVSTDKFDLITVAVVWLVVSVLGNLGDLFESMLKREFGVKDSSNLLPGHGGFLDRFDAILFVFPVLLMLFYLSI